MRILRWLRDALAWLRDELFYWRQGRTGSLLQASEGLPELAFVTRKIASCTSGRQACEPHFLLCDVVSGIDRHNLKIR